ncbi:phosphatidate phosphatase LPIN2-like [Saccoglossus kowalevskii]|uniref:phosphatidate phosphatase n=1 Tax=Saccoglossus kowalevskii TaxID=10224 RepID=A0ABM0MLZ5_SACKO|nr:PREDICTED: phosphatidate phosphatase LPIN1-like [Saccoglossus kowalevskii]
MNYFGRFLSNFKDFYKEINAATLTGAIDVVVVEQEDGSYLCSPFHVRFGKMGVLRSREKVVDIEINGQPVKLHMKLGENGEAFFVEPTIGEVPEYLATSPIQSYADLMEAGLKKLKEEAEKQSASDSEQTLDITEVVEALKEPSETLENNKEEPTNIVEMTIDTGDGTTRTSHVDISTRGSVSNLSEIENSIACKPSSHKTEENTIFIEDETKSSKKTKVRRKRRKSGKGKENRPIPFERCDSQSSVSDITGRSELSEEDIFDLEITSDEEEDAIKMKPLTSMQSTNVVELGETIHSDEEDKLKQLASYHPYIPDFHPFSDGDITPHMSPIMSPRPGTPKSDTEAELHRLDSSLHQEDEVKWNWGELPEHVKLTKQHSNEKNEADKADEATEGDKSTTTESPEEIEAKQNKSMLGSMFQFMRRTKKIRHSQSIEGGIYLEDINDELDPEVAALYFPKTSLRVDNQIRPIKDGDNDDEDIKDENIKDEEHDSDRQTSVQSPNSIDGGASSIDSGLETQTTFEDSSLLTASLLPRGNSSTIASCTIEEPGELLDDLSISLCGGLSETEEPELEKFEQCLVHFDDFCKNPVLLSDPNLVLRLGGKYYNWQTAGPLIMSILVFQKPLPEESVEKISKESSKKEGRRLTSWFSWRRSNKDMDEKGIDKALSDTSQPITPPPSPKKQSRRKNDSSSSEDDVPRRMKKSMSSHNISGESEHQISKEMYRKSIRLSTEQIASLNLKPGANEVVYSVTTQYQGTSRCKSTIYLWKHDDKVIISDIDGTITKSDVFGQILPVFGKDWTQSGVANLYTCIQKNGYQFLYLSARAIGQSSITKGYLKSVKQEKLELPDGPLLLSPTSLITAFHREVIEKKPEEFKISCLRDIQALFPSKNPFCAGFGNKINDVWAYRAVGVPISRIFTINPKGELKYELTQFFQSTYDKLSDLSDHLFPPLHRQASFEFDAPGEFSSFTYWRHPLCELDNNTVLEEEEKPMKASKK